MKIITSALPYAIGVLIALAAWELFLKDALGAGDDEV